MAAAFCIAGRAAAAGFTLVIDPGHGGKDAGALGKFSKEKDLNLKVALAFGGKVERGCRGVKVVYTRKSDTFVPLMERAQIANRNKADLFISIHTNALPGGKTARGFETYTLGMHRAGDNLEVAKRENAVILVEKDYKRTYQGFDPNSAESYIMFELIQGRNMEKSVELARMIQGRVCATASRADKGVHQAGFLVLRETSMPSCLVEMGFITTPDEEASLNTAATQERIAEGLYRAFLQYKERHAAVRAASDSGGAEDRAEETDNGAAQREAVAPETLAGNAGGGEVRAADEQGAVPVFKVQITSALGSLDTDSRILKGEKDVGWYRENGMTKYTRGESADYNEIYRLRKRLLGKFPQAFIVAFKGGEKADVAQAIREYKENKRLRNGK